MEWKRFECSLNTKGYLDSKGVPRSHTTLDPGSSLSCLSQSQGQTTRGIGRLCGVKLPSYDAPPRGPLAVENFGFKKVLLQQKLHVKDP